MNRIVKFLACFLMAVAIFGFAESVNAFDALYKKAYISILEVESKVKQRDIYLTNLTFLAKIWLEILNELKLLTNFYLSDNFRLSRDKSLTMN